MAYQILYSAEAQAHIKALKAHRRALLKANIDEQLTHQPNIETLKRKPMRPNPIASWELRVDELRVYYDVLEDPEEPTVHVIAVGVKVRDRVWIAGQETKL